jgi:hypothetical protein
MFRGRDYVDIGAAARVDGQVWGRVVDIIVVGLPLVSSYQRRGLAMVDALSARVNGSLKPYALVFADERARQGHARPTRQRG